MNTLSTEAIYILSRTPTIGARRCRALMDYFGGASEVLSTSKSELRDSKILPQPGLDYINNRRHIEKLRKEFQKWHKKGYQMISLEDDLYPARLTQIPDPPVLLFIQGKKEVLNHPRTLAIVGTRRPTSYGKEVLDQIIKDLVPFDVHIVSGLAFGIDAMAHRGAIKHQLATSAVMGNGLDLIYPPEHSELSQKITEYGALITEHNPDVKAEKEHFPMRNRIVAGMADVVLVVESKLKGGSMITAHLANGYGREVATIPGSIFHGNSQGPNHLIRNNEAHLITSADDIADLMSWGQRADGRKQLDLFSELSEEERKFVDTVRQNNPMHIDFLKEKLGWSSGDLSLVLLQLEMKGCIRSIAGSRIQLI